MVIYKKIGKISQITAAKITFLSVVSRYTNKQISSISCLMNGLKKLTDVIKTRYGMDLDWV